MTVPPSQPFGWSIMPELPVVNAHRAERAFREIEDFVAVGRSLAGQHIGLVVAVEMHLVGPVAELFALEQFVLDVGLAGDVEQGREEVEAGENAVLDLAGRHVAGPARDHRHAHAAFEDRSLAAGEGCVAAVGPGEVLRAVVGVEDDDGVVLEPVGLEFGEHAADDVVELLHHAFFEIPAVLRRQLRPDISARDAR